jgi:hypothetical protein
MFTFVLFGNWIAEDSDAPALELLHYLNPYANFMWFGLILALLLVITFIIFCIRDASARESGKSQWITMLILLNYIALPLYWYHRIWINKEFTLDDHITQRQN